uniref:Uncharacterized protein n=1 Tax=Cacopsylla melanoneura TaxID=428564 RepID=A0A8D8US19_9HEMI
MSIRQPNLPLTQTQVYKPLTERIRKPTGVILLTRRVTQHQNLTQQRTRMLVILVITNTIPNTLLLETRTLQVIVAPEEHILGTLTRFQVIITNHMEQVVSIMISITTPVLNPIQPPLVQLLTFQYLSRQTMPKVTTNRLTLNKLLNIQLLLQVCLNLSIVLRPASLNTAVLRPACLNTTLLRPT